MADKKTEIGKIPGVGGIGGVGEFTNEEKNASSVARGGVSAMLGKKEDEQMMSPVSPYRYNKKSAIEEIPEEELATEGGKEALFSGLEEFKKKYDVSDKEDDAFYDYNNSYYSQWIKKRNEKKEKQKQEIVDSATIIGEDKEEGASNRDSFGVKYKALSEGVGNVLKYPFSRVGDFFGKGYNLASELYNWGDEEAQLNKLQKKNIKIAEDMVGEGGAINSVSSMRNMEEISDGQRSLINEFDNKKRENTPIIEDYISFEDNAAKLRADADETLEDLIKQYEYRDFKGDKDNMDRVAKEIKALDENYKFDTYKEIYKYVSGTDVEFDSEVDFLNTVKEEFGLNSINDVYPTLNNKQLEKANEAITLNNELNDLAVKADIRTNENMVTKNLNVIERFMNFNGLFLDDGELDKIGMSLYDGVPEKFEAAKKEGEGAVKDFRYRMSFFNQLTEEILNDLGIQRGGMDAVNGKSLYIDLITSDEFKNLKDFMLGGEFSQYVDEGGNFDFVKFGDVLQNSVQFKEFRDLMGKEKRFNTAETNMNSIQGGVEGAMQNVGGMLQFGATYVNEEVFQKLAKMNAYIAEGKAGPIATYIGAPAAMLTNIALGDSIYENELDSYTKNIKRMDIEYQQSPWNTMGDSITTAYRMLKSKPTEAIVMALATYGATSQFAYKALASSKTMASINKINNPVWRNLSKFGAYGAANTVEGFGMNLAFDSFLGTPGENMGYWLIDPAVGALSVFSDIVAGKLVNTIQKDIASIGMRATEKGLAEGTEAYVKFINDAVNIKYGAILDLEGSAYKGIKYSELGNKPRALALALEETIDKTKITQENITKLVTRSSLEQKLLEGLIDDDTITMLYKTYKEENPSLFNSITESLAANNGGKVSKLDTVAEIMSIEKASIGKMAELGLVKAMDIELIQAGMFDGVDKEYNRVLGLIENAKKGATPEQLELLSLAKQDLDAFKASSYKLPYLLATPKAEQQIAKINSLYNSALEQVGANTIKGVTQGTDLLPIPKEIIEARGDMQKISQLVLGDKNKYEELGIKTYDFGDFIKHGEEDIKKILGDEGYNRLNKLMGTIDDINGNNISVIELPNSYKNVVGDVNGFVTHAETVDGKDRFIVGIMGSLADAVKNPSVVGTEYFKTFSHEIGQNILLSLKPEIRAKVLGDVADSFLQKGVNIEKKISEFVPDLSPERLSYLIDLQKKNKRVFVEELSSDIMASAIQGQIFGRPGDVAELGEKIQKQLIKNNRLPSPDNFIDFLASKFIGGFNGLVKYFGGGDVANTKAVLYSIADNISTSQKFWTKDGAAIKEMKTFSMLRNNNGIGDNILKDVIDSKNMKNGIYGDINNETKFYAYKRDGDAAATTKIGVTEFDTAKMYSEPMIRDAIRNGGYSVEELGEMIPIYYNYNMAATKNVLEGLSKKESKTFLDALEYGNKKHQRAVSVVGNFYDQGKGVIDLTKEIEGVGFADTLSNVGVWVTKQGATEYAGADLIKFLKQEDHDQMLTKYINTLTEGDYTNADITKISGVLDSMSYKGANLGEQYTEFTRAVSNKIYQAAKTNVDDFYAMELARDVTSRLFVGGPGYLRVLRENADLAVGNPSKFLDNMAAGLVSKNAKYAGPGYKDDYTRILENLKIDNLTEADELAELFGVGIDGDLIKWQSYTKTYYNYLTARTENYILNGLKAGDIKELNMTSAQFANYLAKISREGSNYEFLIKDKLVEKGVMGVVELNTIGRTNSSEELIERYRQVLTAQKDNIDTMGGDGAFGDIIKYLDDLEENGISQSDTDKIIETYKSKYEAYGDEINIDDYFSNLASVDETNKLWKANFEELEQTFGKKTKEYEDGLKAYNSPEIAGVGEEIDKLLGGFNNLAEETKSVSLNVAVGQVIADKSPLSFMKSMFDVSGSDTDLKLVEKTFGRFNSEYGLELVEKVGEQKRNFLTRATGWLTNIVTVSKYDSTIRDMIYDSVDYFGKTNFIYKDSFLDAYIKSKGKAQKYITNQSFLGSFVDDMGEFVGKKKVTFKQVTDDILNTYQKQYFVGKKDKAAAEKLLGESFSIQDEGYKLLIQSYVDILGRRKQGPGLLKANELKKAFDDVSAAFDKNWILGTDLQKNVNKLEGLRGYWIGLNPKEIAYATTKSEMYSPLMFNNFLYNAFAQHKDAYGFWNKVIKFGKGIEKTTAKAQYALFYNVFFSGLPAAGQQVLTNHIKILGNMASEIGTYRLDNLDEFIDLSESIYRADVVMLNRAELTSDLGGTTQMANNKTSFGKFIDEGLNKSSALAWSDASSELQVKRYSLSAAFLKNGYTKQGAEETIARFSELQKLYKETGLEDFLSFDDLIIKSKKDTLNRIAYKIDSRIKGGEIDVAEGQKIISEVMGMKDELLPIKDLIQDVRVNTQVFYQISNHNHLVQNVLGGWLGATNMRFFNWASRKAGEYAYQVADAILSKDMVKMAKVGTQLSTEVAYASKYYMMLNNLSKSDGKGGGINYGEFMSAASLPVVLFSMMTLQVGPVLLETIGSYKDNIRYNDESDLEYQKKVTMAGGSFVNRLVTNFADAVNFGVTRRPMSSVTFWLGQFGRVANGISKAEEKSGMTAAYSHSIGIPIMQDMLEVFGNVLQSRISKFDTVTVGGYNSRYVGVSEVDSLISMALNAKVSNDARDFGRIMDASYKVMEDPDDKSWFALSLIGNGRDKKFELRALDKYIKDNHLTSFIDGGIDVKGLLEKLEQNMDGDKLESYYGAMGIDYESIVASNDADNLRVFDKMYEGALAEHELSKSQEKELTTGKNTAWNMWQNMLNPAKGGTEQKELYQLGYGLTDEELADYNTKFNDLVALVEKEAAAKPGLLKAAYYDKTSWGDDIQEGLNTFGESAQMAIITKGMASANVSILNEEMKDTFGKNWKRGDEGLELQKYVIDMDSKYKLDLMSNYWNTSLQFNRTIGKNMLLAYTNADEASPVTAMIKSNVGIGIPVIANMFQKTVAAEGIGAFGIDNRISHSLSAVWYDYNGTENEDKPEKLNSIMGLYAGILDYADDMQDESLKINTKVGLISASINNLSDLRNNADPELRDRIVEDGSLKDFLDRVTVSKPLTDEKIQEKIFDNIMKEGGAGGSSGSAKGLKMLAQKLNKFSDFKSGFYKNRLNQTPLDYIQYEFDGGSSIIPLKLSAIKAKKIESEYDWVKLKEPEELKTPDLTVETIKTKSETYKGKSIKGQKIYVIKTKRG